MYNALLHRLEARDLDGAKYLLVESPIDDIEQSLRVLPATERVLAYRLLDKHTALQA
jgi:Mg/Co/Ni transporter MgtE